MSEDRSAHDSGPGAGSVVALTFAVLAVVVAAIISSTFGRFLSFAGADGQASPNFTTIMVIAVFGPYVLAIIASIIGISRVRKSGWIVPLLGVPATWVLFMICANTIG